MTTPSPKSDKPVQTQKPHDHAEEPSRPSESRLGVKESSMAEGGVEIGSLSPGKTDGANLA
jgi:hypothetical protein